MTYEDLLIEADQEGLIVREKSLYSADGLITDKRIAIRRRIPTIQKACVLAEELGHYYTSTGNILDQSSVEARKQERHSRIWAYNKQIGLSSIIRCYKAHCTTTYEMAEYLEVSEDFLRDALDYYQQAYAYGFVIDNYTICFHPTIQVYELVQVEF